MKDIRLLILPGDGIGPETIQEVKKIIDFLNKKKIIKINIEEDLVGGACLDKNHVPIKEGTIKNLSGPQASVLFEIYYYGFKRFIK